MEVSSITTIILFFANKKKSKTAEEEKTKPPVMLKNLIALNLEKRRLRDSFKWQFVRRDDADCVKYYENGHSATVKIDPIDDNDSTRIHHNFIKWDDTGQELTPEEKARALGKIGQFFDRKAIKWKFYDSVEQIPLK